MDARAEDRAKLRLEHLAVGEAVADRAESEERVALGFVRALLGVLVGAEVERADRARPPREELERLAVGAVLLVLARLVVVRQVEELGAVEADAVAAVGEHALDLVRELDVSEQADAGAVLGDGLEPGGLAQRAAMVREALLLVAVVEERLGVGSQHHHARVAVHDHEVAVLRTLHDALAPDDAGDLDGAGDDRRVAGAAAEIGRDAEDLAAVHARGLRRREFVGDDHDGLGEGREARLVLAHELAEDAPLEIEDVVRLLAEDVVADRLELVGDLLEHLGHRRLRVHAVAADAVAHRSEERGILRQSEVEAEDLGGLAAEFLLGAVAQQGDLGRGVAQREIEPRELGSDLVLLDRAVRHVGLGLAEHEHPRDHDPRGHGNALHRLHGLGLGLRVGHRGEQSSESRGCSDRSARLGLGSVRRISEAQGSARPAGMPRGSTAGDPSDRIEAQMKGRRTRRSAAACCSFLRRGGERPRVGTSRPRPVPRGHALPSLTSYSASMTSSLRGASPVASAPPAGPEAFADS